MTASCGLSRRLTTNVSSSSSEKGARACADRVARRPRTSSTLPASAGRDPGLTPATGSGDSHVVARDALVELGWSLLDAERALAEVDDDLPPEERVRLALKKAA